MKDCTIDYIKQLVSINNHFIILCHLIFFLFYASYLNVAFLNILIEIVKKKKKKMFEVCIFYGVIKHFLTLRAEKKKKKTNNK